MLGKQKAKVAPSKARQKAVMCVDAWIRPKIDAVIQTCSLMIHYSVFIREDSGTPEKPPNGNMQEQTDSHRNRNDAPSVSRNVRNLAAEPAHIHAPQNYPY